MFDDLNTMAAALGALELTEIEFNEDCLILPMYRQRLLDSVSTIYGSRAEAERVLDVLGYAFAASDETQATRSARGSSPATPDSRPAGRRGAG